MYIYSNNYWNKSIFNLSNIYIYVIVIIMFLYEFIWILNIIYMIYLLITIENDYKIIINANFMNIYIYINK